MKVLGVSGEHDSGAALVVDGRIVAAANEERFNRQKLTTCFPEASIRAALDVSGVPPDAIDRVALASYMHIPEWVWNRDRESGIQKAIFGLLHATRLDRALFGTDAGARFVCLAHAGIFLLPRILEVRRRLAALGIRGAISVVDHHVAHLASAYYTSGWDRALAITVDASGDGLCARVAVCESGRMRLATSIPFFHSPGLYYASITKILGFKPGREGKVTGLAARGDATKLIGLFRSRMTYAPEKFRFHNAGLYRTPEIDYLAEHTRGHSREDISAAVQKSLEETVCAFVKDAYDRLLPSGAPLCLAGGVFANVRLNQEVAALPQVTEIFVHPHMGDGGLAAGSALALHAKLQPAASRPHRLHDVYFGPAFTREGIVAAIERRKLSYRAVDCPEREAARLLAQEKCIIWCRGAMEYGPRALCHRSILYQAVDPTVNDWLNHRLNRSEFMPFAPVIRDDVADEYFSGIDKARYALEFMTVTLDATERCRREAPAIVHVDNTARPQLIRRDVQPEMYRMLEEYQRLTGLNILINTSCNMHEEPIVCSADDAVDAYQQSDLDALFLDDIVVEHPSAIPLRRRHTPVAQTA